MSKANPTDEELREMGKRIAQQLLDSGNRGQYTLKEWTMGELRAWMKEHESVPDDFQVSATLPSYMFGGQPYTNYLLGMLVTQDMD